MTELWIVGQWQEGDDHRIVWDFQGVFDSEAKAVAACRDWTYFVGPATLNVNLPHERLPADSRWYYPIVRVADEQEAPDGN